MLLFSFMNRVTAQFLGIPSLMKMKKEKFLPIKLREYMFHCKRTIEVPNSCDKLSKTPKSYGTIKYPGYPPKITNAVRLRLLREASKGQSSFREVQKSPNLPIKSSIVRQLLLESPNRVHRNRKKSPALTALHKKMRVYWVKKKVTWTKEK